jgi:hypothetical protein
MDVIYDLLALSKIINYMRLEKEEFSAKAVYYKAKSNRRAESFLQHHYNCEI